MNTLDEGVDERLQAVRIANDPARMQALLGGCLLRRGRGERLESLAIQRIFYLPGVDFSAVYDVRLATDGEKATQILFGSISYEGDAARQFAKAESKAAKGKLVAPGLGAPAYYLPEIDMVLWAYPNDPKLKALRRNVEPEAVREALVHLGGPAAAVRDGWRLGAVNQALVRYIPRKRCVFRYEIEWRQERGPDGAPRSLPAVVLQHVFGKVYDSDEPGREAFAVLAGLWRASQGDARWLRVPRPLHYDPGLRTLWQAALPGSHLAVQAGQVEPRLAAAIGRGLALLHQARLQVRPLLTLDDELVKLRQAVRLVLRVHPEFGAPLAHIEAALERALPGLSRLPLVPAHGTFKLNHLLHDGKAVGLIDFDSVVLADPLYDVANFTSDLHYLEAQGVLPPGRAAKLAHAFHESYAMHAPWGRRDTVLDWYVASLLVRKQALKCVKHLHANAAPKIHAVLQEAVSRLGRSEN